MTARVELQRTREWWHARRGKITSSRILRVVNGSARGWRTLASELAAELSMDEMPAWRGTKAMQRGEWLEPTTLANASIDYGFKPVKVGFLRHRTIPYLGCSSDFLVYEGRGKRRRVINGEGKAPALLSRHMAVVMNRQLPKEYFAQVQLQMEVHGADLTYFISHHPDAHDYRQRTVKIDVPRDQAYIDYMLERCVQFMRFYSFDDDKPISREILETF